MASFLDPLDGSARQWFFHWLRKRPADRSKLLAQKDELAQMKKWSAGQLRWINVMTKHPWMVEQWQEYTANPEQYEKDHPEYRHLKEWNPIANPDLKDIFLGDNEMSHKIYGEKLDLMQWRDEKIKEVKHRYPDASPEELDYLMPELRNDDKEKLMSFYGNKDATKRRVAQRQSYYDFVRKDINPYLVKDADGNVLKNEHNASLLKHQAEVVNHIKRSALPGYEDSLG